MAQYTGDIEKVRNHILDGAYEYAVEVRVNSYALSGEGFNAIRTAFIAGAQFQNERHEQMCKDIGEIEREAFRGPED